MSANVQDVDSSLTSHKFPWKWRISDIENVDKNGCKVFSCFSCGGGSTMGYKLAGYSVIGNCEIDQDMMKIYRKNHNPQYSYLMDIRDFLKLEDYPDELMELDILDGSPPCSVFSTVGKREAGWNTEKKFREGQKAQRLDDLFFYFIEVAAKLKPKVVIAENVTGLLKGNAKGYVNEILKAYGSAGYITQIFKLNAATMGVPQRRERVFFISHKKDMELPKLRLDFHENPILFREVRSDEGISSAETKYGELVRKHFEDGETSIAKIRGKIGEKESGFGSSVYGDNDVATTLVAVGGAYRGCDGDYLSVHDCCAIQTFPLDYDFGKESAKYVCGMSVPPVMMANIASEVYKQWFGEFD